MGQDGHTVLLETTDREGQLVSPRAPQNGGSTTPAGLALLRYRSETTTHEHSLKATRTPTRHTRETPV